MSTLTDAEAARDAAHEHYSDLISTESRLRSEAADLRQRVVTGEGEAVSAVDLADADDRVAHANLQIAGAEQHQRVLSAAVLAARTDEAVDQIVATVPVLGSAVASALDALAPDLDALVMAVQAYDAYAESALRKLNTVATESSRVKLGRWSAPSAGGVPLGSCRGVSQLAVAILPAVETLGANSGLIDGLKQLAGSAPAIPTV